MIHRIPSTPEAVAEQNYQRGFISAFETILSIENDWKKWKEAQKGK